MKFAFCNEMFEKRPLAEVCAVARDLGYDGLELAPFTFAPWANDISPDERRQIRKTIEGAGLEVVGLHWLFVGPTGLHLTMPDETVARKTREYLSVLIDLCGDLGGKVMVLGSPKQRSLTAGQTQEGAFRQAEENLRSVLDHAARRDVRICLEPLSPVETDFMNTVGEGMELIRAISHPNLKIHLDVKAMCAESTPVADVIRSVKAEDVGHFHINDSNLYGPGMGDVDYGPIAEAVKEIGWDKWLSVEVFKYDPDPETIARKSLEYVKRFWPEQV